MEKILVAAALYFVCINGIAFVMIAIDKDAARNKGRRISEGTFIKLAFWGGFAGILISMHCFRHKTRKIVFKIKVSLIGLMYLVGLAVGALYFFA